MAKVSARGELPLSLQDAQAALEQFMDVRRGSDGTVHIALHVPLAEFGLKGEVALEREVEMQFKKERDPLDLNDIYHVAWGAVGEGIYPKFEGQMELIGTEDGRHSTIELCGDYEPPLGLIGKVFDAAVGGRMAQRSAESLIVKIVNELTPHSSSPTRK